MSYHKNSLGRFAVYVAAFADLDGFVPQAGDHWTAMRWPPEKRWDPDTWQDFVVGALRATTRAEQIMAESRGPSSGASDGGPEHD